MPPPFAFASCDLQSLVPAPPPLEPVTPELQRLVERRVAELADPDSDRSNAMLELAKLGSAAVPALVRIIERKGCANRKRQRVDFCNGSGHYDAPCCGDRIWAARELGRLGEDGAAAVPTLIRALTGKPCGLNVPEGVTTCDSPLTRQLPRAASDALAEMGPYGASALTDHGYGGEELPPSMVPFLLKALPNTDDPCDILDDLAAVSPVAVEAVPALVQQLKAEDPHCAIEALGWIGPLAFDAARPLADLLAASEPDATGGHALKLLQALGRIGPGAEDAVPVLIAFAKRSLSEKHRLAGDAIDALAEVGPPAAASLDLLVPLLDEQDYSLRSSATRALGRLGSVAVPYVDRLTDADALVPLGRARPDLVVPKLRARLQSGDAEDQEQIASALGELGPAAAEAVPALLEVLGAGDRDLLGEALQHCADADGDQEADSDQCLADLHAVTLEALGKIRRGGPVVVPRLIAVAKRALPDKAPREANRLHSRAVDALAGFPEQAAQSVPVLVSLLPAWSATRALGQLGPAAKTAVPALRAQQRFSPNAVSEALAKIEKPVDPLRDTIQLEQMLRSADPNTRQRARLATRVLMIERLRCPTALRRGD